MGHIVEAKCMKCGNFFRISHGGGIHFHLLRCNKCGETKSIGFDKIHELHQRYMKGSSLSKHEKELLKNEDIKPIGTNEYYKEIENLTGNCKCSGKFTFKASPRCPKCRSKDIGEGETFALYD